MGQCKEEKVGMTLISIALSETLVQFLLSGFTTLGSLGLEFSKRESTLLSREAVRIPVNFNL